MRRMMPRPRWYRDVRVSRRRRDWHVGVSRPRRDRDSIEWQYRDETEMFKKNASRPSRDRDVRDRDYNPNQRHIHFISRDLFWNSNS